MNVSSIERIDEMSNHEGFSDPTADLAVGRAARAGRKLSFCASGRKRGRPKKGKQKAKFSPAYFTRKFPLPVVYICSPFAMDAEEAASRNPAEDRLKTKRFCRFVISRYCVPVAPHLLYPGFLRDDVKPERSIGNYCGMCLLDKCSEVWVYGDELTNGMEWEIWRAYMRSKTIRWFTDDLKEVEKPLPDACKTLTGPVKGKKKKGEMQHE